MFSRIRFSMLKAGAAAAGPIATAYVMPSASDGWTFNKYRFKFLRQHFAACMEQPSEPSQPSAPRGAGNWQDRASGIDWSSALWSDRLKYDKTANSINIEGVTAKSPDGSKPMAKMAMVP